MYVLVHDADFGQDGRVTYIAGLYEYPELALAIVQKENDEHNLTAFGLLDWKLVRIPVNIQGQWDFSWGTPSQDWFSFRFTDKTERTVELHATESAGN